MRAAPKRYVPEMGESEVRSFSAASVAVVAKHRSSKAVNPVVARPRSGGDAEYGTNLLSKNRIEKKARRRRLGHLAARSNKTALYDRETPV